MAKCLKFSHLSRVSLLPLTVLLGRHQLTVSFFCLRCFSMAWLVIVNHLVFHPACVSFPTTTEHLGHNVHCQVIMSTTNSAIFTASCRPLSVIQCHRTPKSFLVTFFYPTLTLRIFVVLPSTHSSDQQLLLIQLSLLQLNGQHTSCNPIISTLNAFLWIRAHPQSPLGVSAPTRISTKQTPCSAWSVKNPPPQLPAASAM